MNFLCNVPESEIFNFFQQESSKFKQRRAKGFQLLSKIKGSYFKFRIKRTCRENITELRLVLEIGDHDS